MMISKEDLVQLVHTYDPGADASILMKAYDYSMEAHGAQTRASGDLYFTHPLEVAQILISLKLDVASVITGLLHDTIEDTLATVEEIETLFGKEIAFLVDGVTKLSQIELQSSKNQQAENFRKLVLAMSADIRVLLIKLADRLHNMRTLHFVGSEDKRKRISRETMEIYAPLAERIGMHHLKDELEDLSFEVLNPEARESILARLKYLRESGEDTVDHVLEELREVARSNTLEARIFGRQKMPYSIWRKMLHNNVGFEQLSDIMAFRIVVETLPECYQALGIFHSLYPMVPGRFKDYISTPKPNDYKSIHTTVIGPNRQRIEIQIRTREMDDIAELGVAAHWQYKQKEKKPLATRDNQQYRWLRGLLDILEHASCPDEFMEHTRLEMFQDQVFCFTPKGDLIALPQGSSPVDFAYAVHSKVGDTCIGAKVNGRIVPLRTVLKNGDQVDITTSPTQTPSPTWERIVVTGKARASIRRYIRAQQHTQFVKLGRSILQKAFKGEKLEFSEKILEKNLESLKVTALEDVYAKLGEGQITSLEIIRTLFPNHKTAPKKALAPLEPGEALPHPHPEVSVGIRGLIPGMAIHFGGCCHPVAGDPIVGIITTGKGVTVHKSDCENLEHLQGAPERWLDIDWDVKDSGNLYIGRVVIIVMSKPQSLGTLSTLIGKNMGNIVNLKILHRSQDFYDLLVDIEVKDVHHLNTIVAALRSSPLVSSVERPRG